MLPQFICFLFCLLLFSTSTFLAIQTPLFLPITKDHSTQQYTLTIYLKTPPKPTKLLLDLGGSFSWVNCQNHYNSTTYHHIPCNSSLCASLHSLACGNCYDAPGPTCANDTCSLFPENSVTHKVMLSNSLLDSLAFTPKRPGLVPEFLFSCAKSFLLKGLAKGAVGSAGFGRSNFSLPAQVSNAVSLPFLFALCLPAGSTSSASGVGFFGFNGPYKFYPQIDLAKTLFYTPLLLNPVGNTIITYYGYPSDEYFIGLTSMKVNGKAIAINQTILTIDENGFGGTKISTVTPYTILETSIYKAFVEAFVKESAALNLTVRGPVKPFDVCYSAADVLLSRIGPAVPTVDLVMDRADVFWRIFGSNSMVRIQKNGEDLWCLGFVDGGVSPRTAIVIGGHQLENNLLQFDLGLKRLGFSSSLLAHGTTCANFTFTT